MQAELKELMDALYENGFPVSEAAEKALMSGGSLEARRLHLAAKRVRELLYATR